MWGTRQMNKLRTIWQKFIDVDTRIHERLSTRFPTAISGIDRALEYIVDKIISSPIFNVILPLVLTVLGIAGVHILVLISGYAIWLIVFAWVAKAGRLRKLTIVTRFLALLLVAFFLALLVKEFERWALYRHDFEERVGLNNKTPLTAPPAAHTRPPTTTHTPSSATIIMHVSPARPSRPEKRFPVIRPSLPRDEFPVVVKAHINTIDTLSIQNEGRRTIEEVALQWGVFDFDKSSYANEEIKFDRASFTGGGVFSLRLQLSAGKGFQVSLLKFLPIHLEFPNIDAKEEPYPEIGLRITFRDSQDGQKYACYKVFSTVEGFPETWGDEVGVSVPGDHIDWPGKTPQVVIEQMKAHYSDGAKDLQCDR